MMGSRQSCNFVFPSEVGRPIPGQRDRKDEAASGVVGNELDAVVVDDKEEEHDETYELGLQSDLEDEQREEEEEEQEEVG